MFFLLLILIFTLIIVLFITLVVEIEFKDLKINIPKIKNEFIDHNSKLIIRIYLLNKFKVLELYIDKTKLQKTRIRNQIGKFEKKLEKNKNNFDLKTLKILKFLNIDIKRLDLNVYLGLEDSAITAILIGIISALFGLMLKNKIKNSTKQKFCVIPIYQNTNILKIRIDGIFSVNMRNIIYIIFKLIKKGKVRKNVRTSNRRSYAYSDE